MSLNRFLTFYIIFLFGHFAQAQDFFGAGWVPKSLTGEIFLLNNDKEPVPAIDGMEPGKRILTERLPIIVLKDDQGKPIEMEKNGKKYIKVQETINNSSAWAEKRNTSFTFAFPECENFTQKSTLKKRAKTRVLSNSQMIGTRNNYHEESNLVLETPVNCREKWLAACVQGDLGHWNAVWVQSGGTTACNKARTEAVSGVECTDCQTDLQKQVSDFSSIARKVRENARAEFTKYVPEDIHEIAVGTARKERGLAPYLVVQFDRTKFDSYENMGLVTGQDSHREQYNLCKSAISDCHGRKQAKKCTKYQCSKGLPACNSNKCSPPLCSRNKISNLDDWGACYDNEQDPNDNNEINIIRKKNMPETFSGWCLRGVKETLLKAKMIPPGASLGVGPTKGAGGMLKKYGFENKINQFATNTPPYFDQSKIPPGAVILYENPDDQDFYGHAEVFTGELYCSDFCTKRPISKSRPRTTHAPYSRHPIAIYIKTKKP